MKAVQFHRFGPPADVADCVELPDVGAPGAGEAVVRVEATPINPSDLLTLTGEYGRLPPLPAVPGNEGVGVVEAVGDGVKHLKVGDRVMLPLGVGTWREKMLSKADRLFPLPANADPLQLAMLAINPPTAWLLLKSVPLKPGDHVIQNAANSAVGQYLITFAHQQGLKSINVVRRLSLVPELKKLGADVVLVDGPDLQKQVRDAVGPGKVPLGIDAVGGEATQRLASCVSPGGTVVNYGLLGGEACRISPGDLVFRGVTLKGFWLSTWAKEAGSAGVMEVMGEMVKQVAAGTLRAEVDATYPFARIKEAVTHALQPGRKGKILLVG